MGSYIIQLPNKKTIIFPKEGLPYLTLDFPLVIKPVLPYLSFRKINTLETL